MALRRLYSVSVGKTHLLPTSSHYPACIFAHHSACEPGASTNACDVPVDIKFQDPRTANLSKTNMDIVRGLFVFRLCSMPFLVRHNKKLMELGRRLLGRSLFRSFMKMTFYGHFVGGENIESINQVIARIRKFGVKSILDYSVEKDIDETEAVERVKESLAEVVREPKVRPAAATREYQTSLQFADRSQNVIAARTYFYESEYQCDTNMEIFLRCIDYVTSSTKKEGFAAIKLTALGRPQLLLQMSDLLVQMQRLFYLLVGCTKTNSTSGYNRPSLDMDSFRKRLESLGVEISYDENVKWFTLLDVSGDGVVDLLDWSHLKSIEHDLAHIFSVKNKQLMEFYFSCKMRTFQKETQCELFYYFT
ncbi:unnamed protein product [Dicrocoelium dendriticum]|nr:unnamed protein product [Dicrocoelium dendriticum]